MLVGSQKDTWFNSHSVSLAWEDKTGNFLSKFTKITNSKDFLNFSMERCPSMKHYVQ